MIRLSILLFVLALTGQLRAQEVLVPLTINQDLVKPTKPQNKANGCIDSTFQSYTYNTLNLPVWDDFSVNKFVNYNIDFTAPNVSSQVYYQIMDQSNVTPLPASTILCDTSIAHVKTTTINSGVEVTTVNYFTTGQIYTINDLCVYPIESVQKELFTECYVVFDTIIDGVPDSQKDTVFYTSSPDYFQDSVRVFSANMNDPNKIWIDDYALHNYNYAVDPWSLGVATLDGVSNDGYPYDWGAADTYDDADVLTSKPINLSGKTNVYLTFLYQAKGLGDSPEVNDSLILDAYSSSLGHWQSIWAVDGDVTDNEWHIAHIPITQFDLIQPDFQFRFRNKATVTGLLDHWHVDYVNLRDNSTAADTIIDDIAIVYPINSLLKEYTNVPWDHYKNLTTPNDVMKTSDEITVRNNHTSAKLQNTGGLEIDGNSFSLGVLTPNWNVGLNTYDVGYASLYTFPQVVLGDTMADFSVKLNMATTSTNVYDVNDTTYFTQKFRNYYSLDDGSAETAYGFDVYNAKVAMKFEAYEADTLTGVLMKFIPSNTDVSNEIFLLTIWEDDNGEPGDIIYQDSYFEPHYPQYTGQKDQYGYYKFNGGASVVVPKNYFVGFEQIEEQMMYIGMDMNLDNSDKIFYNTTGSWVGTAFSGTLIMRPVYSTGLNSTLSTSEVEKEEAVYTVYPNPTQSQVSVVGLTQNQKIQLFDLSGRLLLESNENSIDLTQFDNGMYILNVVDQSGKINHTQKIIKY